MALLPAERSHPSTIGRCYLALRIDLCAVFLEHIPNNGKPILIIISIFRHAVRLCIRAHCRFPQSEMFSPLSRLTPETVMEALALLGGVF